MMDTRFISPPPTTVAAVASPPPAVVEEETPSSTSTSSTSQATDDIKVGVTTDPVTEKKVPIETAVEERKVVDGFGVVDAESDLRRRLEKGPEFVVSTTATTSNDPTTAEDPAATKGEEPAVAVMEAQGQSSDTLTEMRQMQERTKQRIEQMRRRANEDAVIAKKDEAEKKVGSTIATTNSDLLNAEWKNPTTMEGPEGKDTSQSNGSQMGDGLEVETDASVSDGTTTANSNNDDQSLEPPENLMMVQNAVSQMTAAAEQPSQQQQQQQQEASPTRPVQSPPRALLQRAVMADAIRRNNSKNTGRTSPTARSMSNTDEDDNIIIVTNKNSRRNGSTPTSSRLVWDPDHLPYFANLEPKVKKSKETE